MRRAALLLATVLSTQAQDAEMVLRTLVGYTAMSNTRPLTPKQKEEVATLGQQAQSAARQGFYRRVIPSYPHRRKSRAQCRSGSRLPSSDQCETRSRCAPIPGAFHGSAHSAAPAGSCAPPESAHGFRFQQRPCDVSPLALMAMMGGVDASGKGHFPNPRFLF